MPLETAPVGQSALLDPGVVLDVIGSRVKSTLPPETDRERKNFVVAAIFTIIVAIMPAVLWPGAISWHWDEPVLVGQAFYYNQAHYPATRGLGGSFFIPYGPLPTQFYQFALLFTHDPRVIVFFRALLFSATLAGSFLWLARSLRLTPWFVAAVLLAPFLNWTERDLWDATFAMPVGVLAMAAYAAFLRNRSRTLLALAMAAAAMGPLIHMQGLPLFAAIVGHAFWRHRDALRRHKRAIGWALLPLVLLNLCYIFIFFQFFIPKMFGMVSRGYGGRSSGGDMLESLCGPLLGGKILTGENWVVTQVGLPGPPALVPLATNLSFILIGLIWLGIIASAVRTIQFFGRAHRSQGPESTGQDAAGARDQITQICLAALIMQIVLATVLRVPPDPQYSFGTFPIHVMFAWFGVELLRRIRLGHLVTAIYGLAVGYLTIGGNWSVHHRGWQRGFMSPPLNEQIEIVQELNRYNNPTVYTNVGIFQRFPHALATLRLLNPPTNTAGPADGPHRLYIRYRLNGDPTTQRVELIDLDHDPIPADAKEIDVSPGARMY